MYKVNILKNAIVTNSAQFEIMELLNEWLDKEITNQSFGKSAYDEFIPAVTEKQINIITPEQTIEHAAWDETIPAVLDENGIIIEEEKIVNHPAFDEVVQAVTEEVIVEITPSSIVHHEAEFTVEIEDVTAAHDAELLARKYSDLWSAANAYQSAQVSGAAIGLLTLGVIMQKPKCTAVQAWIKSVWVEYYTRKAGVSLQNNVNLDFSVCGNILYTVPELMEEVSI